jgi:hypothetical protein
VVDSLPPFVAGPLGEVITEATTPPLPAGSSGLPFRSIRSVTDTCR